MSIWIGRKHPLISKLYFEPSGNVYSKLSISIGDVLASSEVYAEMTLEKFDGTSITLTR